MRVIIRVDAGRHIGSGHVMRCLTLAHGLKKSGHEVTFISRAHQGHLFEYIEQQGFPLIKLVKPKSINTGSYEGWLGLSQLDDAQECLLVLDSKFAQVAPFDLCIVDHYSLDKTWQQAFKSAYKKLFVIDDLANREHIADYLLDQTFARNKADYQRLVSEHCQYLVGEQFILLRDEFYALHSQATTKAKNYLQDPENKRLEHILVSLGGVDNDNVTLTCINALKDLKAKLPYLHATITLSAIAPHRDSLANLIEKYDWLELVVNASDMAKRLLSADLAIGAAGTSAWERCFMGLPSINITLAENQLEIAKNLADTGAAISLGMAPINHKSLDSEKSVQQFRERLTNACHQLLTTPAQYLKMVECCFKICDGKGLERALTAINANGLERNLDQLHYLPATQAHCDLIYQWQCLPGVRTFSRNPQPPEYQAHCQWYQEMLNDSARQLYLLNYQGALTGFIRLDKLNHKERASYEISIVINPEFHGRGLGYMALVGLTRLVNHCDIYAYVKPENIPSTKLFKKAGFTQINDCEYRLSIQE